MSGFGYWVGGSIATGLGRFKEVLHFLQGRSLGIDLRYLDPDATTAELMMPLLCDADLIIADLTPEREGEDVLGVHPRPILAATLGRYLFLIPTYTVSIGNDPEVPYNWRHFHESKFFPDDHRMNSWLLDLLEKGRFPGPKPINSLFPAYVPEIFAARPYPSDAFLKQATLAASSVGKGITVYETSATSADAILSGILRKIEGAQAFIADFSTEDRSRHYPNASVLTEAVLAKWVYRKSVPLLVFSRIDNLPEESGWEDQPILRYSASMETIPSGGGNGKPMSQVITEEILNNGIFPAARDRWNALAQWILFRARYRWRPFRKYKWPFAILSLGIFVAVWLWAHPDDPGYYWRAGCKLATLSTLLAIAFIMVGKAFFAIFRPFWRVMRLK